MRPHKQPSNCRILEDKVMRQARWSDQLGGDGMGNGQKQIQPTEVAAKYMMGFFTHGKNMRWWKMWTATTCPRCREEDEDKTHMIRCKHKTAQQQWDKALTELENWMIMAKTKPMIQTTIIMQLRKWRTGEDNMEHGEPGAYMTHAQDKIGWNLALEGVLTLQWHMQQEQYWQRIKLCWSAKWWTSKLIKKLWQVAWDMWRHRNSALHDTKAGKVLIVEGDINRTVIW